MPNIAELWLSAPHQRICVMPSLHWGKLIGYWYFLRNFDQSVIKNCLVECKREWTCARMKSYTWEKRSNAGQRKGKAGLNSLHWKRCGEQEEQTTEKKKEWVKKEGMLELLVIPWETWSRCAVWSSVDQMTYQRSGQPLATCLFLLSSLICNWLSLLTLKISILHTLVLFQVESWL